MRSKIDHGLPSLRQALRPVRFALGAAAAFSLGINILMLVSPLYLMQVFDRVITSANLDTLFWLTALAVGCLAIYALLEVARGRVLSKVGIWLEASVTERLICRAMRRARAGRQSTAAGTQALRDLAQVRGFLAGPSIHALFDVPWSLVFVAILALMHAWYGALALGSVGLLLALAAAGELATRGRARAATAAHTAALAEVDGALRNAETVHAMGMIPAILARWTTTHGAASDDQDRLNDRAVLLAGVSKFIRMAVQIAVVAIGAILVVKHEVSTGALIAASILLGRALAPVDQAIAGWKQIAGVRAAWRRVDEALAASAVESEPMRLPAPAGQVSLEQVTLRAPDGSILLGNVSFALKAGESMAIVGPSAAGKSLLCKVLAGIVTPQYGAVRIDGAELHTWHPDDLRPHVGYLPQDIALFAGTVGDNIARLGEVEATEIVRAATLAGVHELILRLPDGYQTDVGEFGHLLSGGQRQRIALARAMLGAPRLVILDEPNSNLDPAGEVALFRAIDELKAQGCTVVIVSHKLGLVRKLDKTLLLRDGAVQAIGPSGEVLSILMAENRPPLPAAAQAPSTALSSAR